MQGERSLLVTVLLLLLIGAVLAQPMGTGIGVDIEVDFQRGRGVVNMNYTLTESGFSKSINAGFFPVDVNRTDEVYLFVDEKGVNGSIYPRVLGLRDHMKANLDVLGSDIEILTVDFDDLDEIFEGPNATVILPSQPSNSTEFGLKAKGWVERGGVLIAIGNRSLPFLADYLSGQWIGPEEFLRIRYRELDFMGGKGMTAPPSANAMGFQTVAPTMAISLDDLSDYDGKAIGYIYDRGEMLTSAALLKVGEGRVMMLGGHIANPFLTTAEDAVANDLVITILTSLPWISGNITYERLTSGSSPISGGLSADLSESPYLSVFVFERDNIQMMFFSRVVDA